MKEFFKSQLDEISQNKLRIGLLTLILIGTLIYASTDFETGEEIELDETAKDLSAKTVAVNSEKVKSVIGASNEEFYIYDPFHNPAPPDEKVEEILPPVEPVIIVQPVEKVEEVPKPPEEKFILKAVALSENKTALVEKISEGNVETIFVKIGDTIGGKKISDIDADFIKFDDNSIMTIENF